MDARQPVTLEEGDRYPLGPPSFTALAQLDLEHCATNAGVGSSNLSGGAKRTQNYANKTQHIELQRTGIRASGS